MSDYRKIMEREIAHGAALGHEAEEAWNWSSPAGQARAERRAELLFQAGRLFPGARTLELGCGTGIFTEKISARGAQILAVDISPDLIALAKKRTYHSPVEFYCGDFLTLSGVEETFDAVWGSSVLHHLPVELFLPRIYQVLKPGGYMAFAEPNMLNPQIFAERNIPMIRRWARNTPDETAFVRYSLKRKLTSIGFEEVKIVPHEWLHPAVPKGLIQTVKRLGSILERTPILKEFAGSLLISARRPIKP
jgi:2-polyprenyl-3-methyl-5-hydroxy-6-metoxy-1,4-benzoquinol methylase